MATFHRIASILVLALLGACGGGDYQPTNGDPCTAPGSVGWVAGVITDGVCQAKP